MNPVVKVLCEILSSRCETPQRISEAVKVCTSSMDLCLKIASAQGKGASTLQGKANLSKWKRLLYLFIRSNIEDINLGLIARHSQQDCKPYIVVMKPEFVSPTQKPLPSLFDGDYFEVASREEDVLIVRCNTCGPEGPQLRASIRSNGNLLKHIQRRHPELLHIIKREKNIKTRSGRHSVANTTPPSKRPKFETISLPNPLPDDTADDDDEDDDNESVSLIRNGGDENVPTFIATDKSTPMVQQTGKVVENYIITLGSTGPNLSLADASKETIASQNDYGSEVDHLSSKYEEEPCYEEEHLFEEKRFKVREPIVRRVDAKRGGPDVSQDLVALQKDLLLREFNEFQEMRREKHRLELSILNQDLMFREQEHRKKIEYWSMKLLEK